MSSPVRKRKDVSQIQDDGSEAKATPSIDPSPVKKDGPSMLHGASLLISLQLTSRLLTFIANQALLRLLTAAHLGLSAQLEVYYLSILFFARESLRVAIQRQAPSSAADQKGEKVGQGEEAQAVVNLGYLAVILGVFVSTGLGWMYLGWASSGDKFLREAVWIYGVAAMLELLSEPCFVLMQTRLQFGTRAVAESSATFLRCAVVFGSALYASRTGTDLGVLPFALGQITYGTVLLMVYCVAGGKLAASLNFSLLPRSIGRGEEFVVGYFYKPTISIAGSMMAQSFVKHILTQGDTLLISALSDITVQGSYAVANNYGGLIARLLFQPIEESSRSYFSRLLAAPEKQSVGAARSSLHTLLRFYILLSLLVLSLGPFAVYPLLRILLGDRWAATGTAHVMAAYCLFIPFLALNGILEAFVASVASEGDVHRQSGWMFVFSLIFGGSAWLFMSALHLGGVGLVLANSVNMACRIVWCCVFISSFFRKHGSELGLASLIPNGAVFLAAATSGAMYMANPVEDAEVEPIMALVRVAGFAIPLILSL